VQTTDPVPGNWVLSHWAQIVGFSAVATALYRFYTWIKTLVGYGESIEATRTDMNILLTNHLPHIQAKLVKMNTTLEGMREDMKESLARLSNDIRVVLTRMD
jgi:hypothetical protein